MSACRHPGVPEDCHGRRHNQTTAAKIIDRRSGNRKIRCTLDGKASKA